MTAESTHVRPCPNCGRDWGTGLACQFCSQVEGLPLGVYISSPGRRLGGFLLDALLIIVTAVIGWFIWSLFTWSDGQTPAKKVLGMRCVKLRTDQAASWGTMCVREVIAKPVIWVLACMTFGIVYFWLVWDKNTQELWDKMVDTIVVNDPNAVLQPEKQRAHEATEWEPEVGDSAGGVAGMDEGEAGPHRPQ